MTQAYRSSLRRLWKTSALFGLLALALPAAGGSLREAAADDGVAWISSPTAQPYAYANCSRHDPDFLNADYSYGVGPGRIPFDRWYYLRRTLGYTRIYPANTHYSDPRDRRLYSAWGYGVPMAVPLASNVVYQYNYSTGPQASRLTSVSRPVP